MIPATLRRASGQKLLPRSTNGPGLWVAAPTTLLGDADSIRCFSSKGFRPRRKPNRNYRPVKPEKKKIFDPHKGKHNDHKFVNLGEADDTQGLGPLAQDLVEEVRRDRKDLLERKQPFDDSEEHLRMLDYYIAEVGSNEDLVGLRRGLAAQGDSKEFQQKFLDSLDETEMDALKESLRIDSETLEKEEKHHRENPIDLKDLGTDVQQFDTDPDTAFDPNQLAHGDWSEMLVTVDRTSKLWRGGRLESYRALLVGGNLNGCGGFGVGKSKDPLEAVQKASRICKRNIFFVDRYQGNGLTRDLAGKQNNCKVVIRSTDNGLRGNPLVCEILKRMGITNASSKAYGRRTPSNVVLGTFKALMTHESLEDMALKRGKRLINLERIHRLQI